MALALYRKYRPRTFAEVIGQEHVTEPLSQALRSGRLHHAYLFSGPRGCGKTSSARILARSLNCEQGPTPEPCGTCGSCRSLTNDGAGSIDVIEIDAASHGGVDDARELREKAFFAPASSRFKIYVIDEAHMVSSAGFNALLKLVEEPPDYVKFIFATTEPEKVLGTIRSRTHHYPFRLIPPPVLRPYLQQLTEAEGVHVEPAVFPLVVRAGGGSARDSLSVLDQLIAGAGPDGVSYNRAVALLGVTDVSLIDDMCDAVAAADGAAAYSTIDRVSEAGHDPRRFASDLLERFRDLIVLQQVPDAVAKGLIDGPADQLEAMTAQSTRLGPATLSRCADIVHNGLVEMRGTTAPRLLLELITARMLLPGADDATGALLQRLERMERRLTLTTEDAVRAQTAPPATPTTPATSAPATPVSAAPVSTGPSSAAPPAAAPTPAPAGPTGGGLSAARAAAAAAAAAAGKRAAPAASTRPTTPAHPTQAQSAPTPAAPDGPATSSPPPQATAPQSAPAESAPQSAPSQPSAPQSAPAESAPQDAARAPAAGAGATSHEAHGGSAQPEPHDEEPPWDEEPDYDPYLEEAGPTSQPPAARSSHPTPPAAPASAAPVSAAPVSAAPVSAAPVSAAPVSAAPVSAARERSGEAAEPAAEVAGPAAAPSGRRAEPAGVLPDAPEEPVVAALAEVPGQMTVEAVREVWPDIVAAIKRQPNGKVAGPMAAGAVVRALDGDTVVLVFQFPNHADRIGRESALVTDALYEALGGRWQIRCEVGGRDAAEPPSRGRERRDAPPAARPAERNEPPRASTSRAAQTPRASSGGQPAAARAPQDRRQASDAPPPADDEWPEPAKPGGHSSAAPAVDDDEEWPEVSPIGASGDAPPAGGGGAPILPSRAGATPVEETASAARGPLTSSPGARSSASTGAAAGDPEPSPAGSVPSIGGVEAAASTGGVQHNGGAAVSDGGGAAVRDGGGAATMAGADGPVIGMASAPAGVDAAGRNVAGPNGGGSAAPAARAPETELPAAPSARNAAPSSGLAAARAAARNAAAARQAAKPAAAAAPAVGPAAGSAPAQRPEASSGDSSFDGFDPGDEPLDDVIDEKTARESSEQQAFRLLQEVLGAEKIGES
ncbi:DNA polymerase III subunit gamma and tau [Paractinoplanes rishiriensis]|uniref:DNA polymerase III subunit gamma/tau n=1 Tax=Paractinoplanes rishiriensis TaxID=1050105 RepID=A0A919K9D1_9ACTN|nr:DNA polymerase III subunit gamma and tau [Actinoplanes rishiriensis]GIF01823.1 hypothetical protein Ari01nite_92870 [Actinoplanes rishiriensis]